MPDRYVADLESLAEWAYETAALPVDAPDPRWLAVRLPGLAIRRGNPPGTGGAALRVSRDQEEIRGVIVYQPSSKRRQGTAILHEIAHWLLENGPHDHKDVWLLTCMLALPRERALRLGTKTLQQSRVQRFHPHAEIWLLELRVALLLLLETRAA